MPRLNWPAYIAPSPAAREKGSGDEGKPSRRMRVTVSLAEGEECRGEGVAAPDRERGKRDSDGQNQGICGKL